MLTKEERKKRMDLEINELKRVGKKVIGGNVDDLKIEFNLSVIKNEK